MNKNVQSLATQNTPSSWKRDFLASYLLFGFLHEASHILAATLLGFDTNLNSLSITQWFGVLLLRVSEIPSLETANPWEIKVVKHSGWITSIILAALVITIINHFNKKANEKKNRKDGSVTTMTRQLDDPIKWAALVTALEAVCTDLMGFGGFAGKTTFFCGNFGIILLNPSWTSTPGDYGKTALDLLQKMIQVTMMRGAQTGGVVTWIGGSVGAGKNKSRQAPTSVRCRVVNGKRTDLSEEVRKLLNKKICSGKRINPSIKCLMGHTRFATSSKATMDGTHPHQWSPPEKRQIYPLDDAKLWSSENPEPIVQDVSNFITHNGDLDFFIVNGQHADLELIQAWLAKSTGYPLPAPVDSVAIAGLVDIIRCAGCFALSARYAYLIASRRSAITTDRHFPKNADYDKLAAFFDKSTKEFCASNHSTMADIKNKKALRNSLCRFIFSTSRSNFDLSGSAFAEYASFDDEEQTLGDLSQVPFFDLIEKSIDAFFDNDLMETTKIFLARAVGSFGLMITSSMDAHRQICIAARGQPMSIAFYPDKGVICYGSELAAVKAGMTFDNPAGNVASHGSSSKKLTDMTLETCRFDLDDLGGEVALVDFSSGEANVKTYQEGKTAGNVRSRITPLEGNEFLLPLTPDKDDPILDDIQSIPAVLQGIQQRWQEGGLNRITAWNLGKKLDERLKGRAEGKYGGSVDIMLAGCEVSLWLAEQFASDLQKSFPKLRIQATSSNKLLGVLGQELSVPSIGHAMSSNIPDLKNTIVILVSHSGGTFASLAISNLLQSVTKNIFVVSSEWDTQIGKQLRGMSKTDGDFLASRVFTTDIGVRPAEPCSLSVVATHQLLTQIFEYICLIVLRNHVSRDLAGAVITHQDLRVLERCNQDVIGALERMVGKTAKGEPTDTVVRKELKAAGDLWADHVLENARAYIMSIIYIVVTVTIGYPLVSGIATAAGLTTDWAFYITRFFDSIIYVLLPQINITILRLIQGRDLLHRMVGRTVVIGDVPWVAQSAEAFLSKIFARSYSIAGLNVLSGNPSDHLVHRHTHRVTRGSLLVCGRPDGRLTALTSAECAVNLSVNQASSIQSIGGTCESITIGHNPAKLGLTRMDIALSTTRPKFLCEQLLDSMDEETRRKQQALESKLHVGTSTAGKNGGFLKSLCRKFAGSGDTDDESDVLSRSSHSLKGAYLGMRASSTKGFSEDGPDGEGMNGIDITTEEFKVQNIQKSKENAILQGLLSKNKKSSDVRKLFNAIDTDKSGSVDLEEFIEAYSQMNSGLTREEVECIFKEADVDDSGELDYEEFEAAMNVQGADILRRLQHMEYRDEKGILNVQPSGESYFGADMHSKASSGISAFAQENSQHFSIELYEARIASMERFVAFCVMFHQLGKRVQDFFPKYSFGFMNYKMERTHSIMRIATTASPVSGDAVRDMMEVLRLQSRYENAAHAIQNAWSQMQQRRFAAMKKGGNMHSPSTRTLLESSKRSVASANEVGDARPDVVPEEINEVEVSLDDKKEN